MAQQTAVDLIISQLKKQKEILKNHFEAGKWNDDRVSEIINCISICENTKQMEKEQIVQAYVEGINLVPCDVNSTDELDAEKYYDKTFGNK